MHEGIPILNFLVPKAFLHENGARGMTFEGRASVPSTTPAAAAWCPPASRTCSSLRRGAGRDRARRTLPLDRARLGIELRQVGCRWSTRRRTSRPCRNVFFGGDAAFGPKNIIWAVAHGHEAAVSIDRLLQRRDPRPPAPDVNLMSQKMGIHEWSYDNATSRSTRASRCRGRRRRKALTASRSRSSSASTPDRGGRAPSAASTATCRRCSPATVHRMRRLRRHLPDGLHHLHRERRGGRPAHAPEGAGLNETWPGPVRLRPR